jgi:hypothetical protein
MMELCGKCKKPIKPGETTISVVKSLKKVFYHARCFGAKYLEEKSQPVGQSNSMTSTPAVKTGL